MGTAGLLGNNAEGVDEMRAVGGEAPLGEAGGGVAGEGRSEQAVVGGEEGHAGGTVEGNGVEGDGECVAGAGGGEGERAGEGVAPRLTVADAPGCVGLDGEAVAVGERAVTVGALDMEDLVGGQDRGGVGKPDEGGIVGVAGGAGNLGHGEWGLGRLSDKSGVLRSGSSGVRVAEKSELLGKV